MAAELRVHITMSIAFILTVLLTTARQCVAQASMPVPPLSSFQLDRARLTPPVADASAMCSAEGITAQIMFNGPFYGKIYSRSYSDAHECVYYNSYDMNMILFTIPNYACGTQVQRNAQNVIQRISNEVYVQYDKDTQTSADRRFLFICQLVDDGTSNNNIDNTPQGPRSGTVTPGQTIVVQTPSQQQIVVEQSSLDQPDVSMEIQEGASGPFSALVQRPLELGDDVTLVVRANDAQSSANARELFVHSCYASDGGARKVMLIDERGCTARSQVAQQMQRTRDAMGRLVYYFSINAFKFPGVDDVYFTCTVEMCAQCGARPICGVSGRRRRQLESSNRQLLNVDNRLVHDTIKIFDGQHANARSSAHCANISTIYTLAAIIGAQLLMLIVLTSLFITILNRRRDKAAETVVPTRTTTRR